MNLDQFVAKYDGKKIDFDGHFGAQCVDLIRQYINEVLGTQQPYGVVGAYQLLDNLPVGYEVHLSGEIKPGDILVWNKGYGENGHTAIVLESNPQQVRVFEQNNPIGTKCHSAWHNYGLVRGWFRPKAQMSKTFMTVSVVANKNNWTTLPAQVKALSDYFILHSGNRLETVGNIVQSNFSNIPLVPFLGGDGGKSIDPNWYRSNVTPLCTGQISLFTLNPEDYPNGSTWGFMTYGDPGRPVRCEISPKENIPNTDGTPVFVIQAFHEICHAIFFLTGQPDRVHELIYPLPGNPKAILDLVDYRALQNALVKIH